MRESLIKVTTTGDGPMTGPEMDLHVLRRCWLKGWVWCQGQYDPNLRVTVRMPKLWWRALDWFSPSLAKLLRKRGHRTITGNFMFLDFKTEDPHLILRGEWLIERRRKKEHQHGAGAASIEVG